MPRAVYVVTGDRKHLAQEVNSALVGCVEEREREGG